MTTARKSKTKRSAKKPRKRPLRKPARLGFTDALQAMLRINELRQTRVRLSDLAKKLEGRPSLKALGRLLETLQDFWNSEFHKDLFKIVNEFGEEWQQGSRDPQYIERVSDPLDVTGVESLHRRLISMIAMQRLLTVKNPEIISDEFRGVAKKIKENTGGRRPDLLHLAEKKFYAKVKGTIDFKKYDDVLDDIYDGLINSQKIIITKYGDPDDAPGKKLLPLCLISYNANLYLAAHLDEDKRPKRKIYTFEITKIKKVSLTKEKFPYPSHFDPEAEFGSRFGLFDGDKNHTVKLRIKANSRVIHHVSERTWGPNQSIKQQSDGSVILTFAANNIIEVVPFVLGYGAEVEVLAPAELVTEMKKVTHQLKSIYP